MESDSGILIPSRAIASDTKTVDEYFKTNGLSSPSFDYNGPQELAIPSSGKILEAYERVIDNTRELQMLMLAPSRCLRSTGVRCLLD